MSIYHDNLAKNHEKVSYRIHNHAEYDISPYYPYGFAIQQTSENHGSCITQMAPLMYMFLGNFFDTYSPKTPNLDFKMYASPPINDKLKTINKPNFYQRKTIEFWINLIAKEERSIFSNTLSESDRSTSAVLRRRCLTFSLLTLEKSIVDSCGHRITLMIQRQGDGPIDLVIFDNIEEDYYHVDVHGYILEAMTEYTKTQIFKINGKHKEFSIRINRHSIDTEKIQLKFDMPYMSCISISLRMCIYLSIIKDFDVINETESVYDLHLSHYTQQLRRMIHWIYNSVEYDLQQRIPIRSPEMTKLAFPVQKTHCYLGFIDAVKLPKIFMTRGSNDTKIRYLLDRGDPTYYDYSNDERNTFVPRHKPIKNVCVTQSRFLY